MQTLGLHNIEPCQQAISWIAGESGLFCAWVAVTFSERSGNNAHPDWLHAQLHHFLDATHTPTTS